MNEFFKHYCEGPKIKKFILQPMNTKSLLFLPWFNISEIIPEILSGQNDKKYEKNICYQLIALISLREQKLKSKKEFLWVV